ncbi:tetratricopeptide repeat protein [Fluviicola taffensis]|uniref:tetratricopeptide repeat protein n=1 Tax=Fluviicola taffensis TaxID=191579 RepID=UPI00145F1B3A|nr:tetratricopeptide repeat protein [Fluviicola taffensis]
MFGQDWKETVNQARRLYKKGDYKEALKYYKRAEQLAPNDVDLSQEIGQTAYKANDFKTASEHFEHLAKTAKTKQKEIQAKTNLGESRMKQQDYQGAIDTYKDVLRLDQDNEKARQRLMEAKRLLEQQKKQQDKKDKENKNQNKDNQDQDQQNKSDQDKKEQQNKKQQDQQSQGNKSEKQKLEDKETERKLDEFSKQEQHTKKRLDGSKGTTGGSKARKDW